MDDFVRVVLPKRYDLVVGDTFQLFYRGIIEAADPFCYDILAVCEKGKNFPRYFEFLPDEEGEYRLTVTVYSNDKRVIAQGETKLCVYEARQAPKKSVNILCVGDSLTAGGVWVEEAHRRLSASDGEPCGHGFGEFNFIGTCKKGNVGYEGYGGWQWDNYLHAEEGSLSAVWIESSNNKTEADQHSIWKDEKGYLWQLETLEPKRLKFNRVESHDGPLPEKDSILVHVKNAQNVEQIPVGGAYSERLNPFANSKTGNVDFLHYCEENSFDGIDAVYFFLTWNGRWCDEDDVSFCQGLVEKGKRLVDILHDQYPKAKVRIMGLQVPSVNGGTGASYGAMPPYCDDYGLTRFVMELNRAYEAWALENEYKEFVEFINISGQFDSDYNMPNAEKCVNTRNSRKEIIGTNGVHPLPEGYLQIADAVYRNLIKTYCTDDK